MFKGKYRWAMMWFLCLLMIINFLDRIVISVATGPILEEFKFTNTQWGVILSAFFWGLVPFSLVAGIAADKFGAKKVVTLGALVWSIFTVATIGAWNYVSLLIARVMFGVGEGPTMSNGMRIITNWMTPKEYSTAYGIAFGGVFLGPALGAPVIAWLISLYGWRMPFILLGVLGILWVLLWRKVFTDRPEDNRFMSEEEKELILTEQREIVTASKKKDSLKKLLSIPKGFRATIIANWWQALCYGYASYFLLTWLPGYLSMERELSLQSVGIALMFPFFAATLGLIFGGRISDTLLKRTGNKRIARSFLSAVSFLIVGVSLIYAVQVETVVTAITLITIASFANACAGCTPGPIIADTLPGQVGSQAGLLQVFQTLPGIFAPVLTGLIVDATGSFTNAFLIARVLMVTAVITNIIFLRPPNNITLNSNKNETIITVNH